MKYCITDVIQNLSVLIMISVVMNKKYEVKENVRLVVFTDLLTNNLPFFYKQMVSRLQFAVTVYTFF